MHRLSCENVCHGFTNENYKGHKRFTKRCQNSVTDEKQKLDKHVDIICDFYTDVGSNPTTSTNVTPD